MIYRVTYPSVSVDLTAEELTRFAANVASTTPPGWDAIFHVETIKEDAS